jgi:uncharacterized damage-inducible protein DinB
MRASVAATGDDANTCHHRTQVQTWLRLAGHEPVPAIYGISGDAKWDAADPT